MGETSTKLSGGGKCGMKFKTIRNNAYFLGLILRYTPGFFFATMFESLKSGLIGSFFSVGLIKIIFDMIENGTPFSRILGLIGIVAVVYILSDFYCYWYWRVIEPKARMELHGKMHEKVFAKAKELDLSCYDSPEYFNDFVWANHEADSRALIVMTEFQRALSSVLSTLIITGILLSIDTLVVLVIICSVGLSAVLRIIQTKLKYKRDLELNPQNRRAEYVGRVFYMEDYAKEIRLSHATDILEREYDVAVENSNRTIRRFGGKMFGVGTAQSMVTNMLFDVGILIFLTYKIYVEKSLSLGDFAACLGAVWSLFWRMNRFMSLFANFKEHGLYAEKLRRFLNCKPTVRDRLEAASFDEPFSGMELENVTFTYPGCAEPTLRNISMKIGPKQKIALVGYNGAGKSTLIKLLMRLYDPTEGEIRANGKDIRDYTVDSYRRKFGTVFQDYRIYATSISENVLMDVYRETDRQTVTDALIQSSFAEKLGTLPNGIDSELTREFHNDGVMLSGGEAQKIAIARIFARPSDLVILDEPSSALDPMSEYELNHAMMSAAFDKTVIFISHRLSTTCMADVIYMLENGEIIESGTHDDLMKLNGKYAEMFRVQAEKYRKSSGTVE